MIMSNSQKTDLRAWLLELEWADGAGLLDRLPCSFFPPASTYPLAQPAAPPNDFDKQFASDAGLSVDPRLGLKFVALASLEKAARVQSFSTASARLLRRC